MQILSNALSNMLLEINYSLLRSTLCRLILDIEGNLVVKGLGREASELMEWYLTRACIVRYAAHKHQTYFTLHITVSTS
jgi:hypothetical protein